MTDPNTPISLEKKAYDAFLQDWKNMKYAGQRFGQAFFNHFKQSKMNAEQAKVLDKINNEKDDCKVMYLINKIISIQ